MSTAKKKAKPKKLSVKQVEQLKAGATWCTETRCTGETCGKQGVKSSLFCDGKDNKNTVNVASAGAVSGSKMGVSS